MIVSVLASGSKGNCTYIQTKKHHILVDLGTTSLNVEKKLKGFGIDPASIDSIFITHAHKDHVGGINVFYKKYKPTIYTTKNIIEEAKLKIDNYTSLNEEIKLDDLSIIPIPTSHDALDSRGYIFISNNSSVVYMTDTGYINKKYNQLLYDRSLYIFESNHDIELLMNNPHYPYYLKQRILGDEGHLSNVDSANYLCKYIGPNTKKIFLAHLSEENNTPSLALDNLKEVLKKKKIDFDNIEVATQEGPTELVEV